MPRARLARVSTGAGAKSTASGVCEGSSIRATSRNAAGPTKRRAFWPRITSTLLPVPAISLATAGIARAPGEAPTERRIKIKAFALVSGCAFVARCARVEVRLLGDAGACWRADEVIGISRPDFFHVLRGLPEGHVQLVLAQLLDGDGQRMLGSGVDLRARDAKGIVEAQGRGVLVDLARSLGAGHGEAVAESTLSRSSSILRSCSIFASSYYRLHLLDHVLAGPLPVLVYDLMVELVSGRDLPHGRRQPALQCFFRLSSPSCEPAAGLFQRRSAHEDHNGIRTFYLDLPRTLELQLENHGLSLVQKLLDLPLRRPIEVTRVFGPLQKAALLDPTLELRAGEEDVVSTIHFAGTRLPCRGRNRISQLRHGLKRSLYQRRLSCSGGTGDDDQPSSHPRALIKRSLCPCVSPTRVLERLMPASLITRVTLMRPIPLTARSISSTLAPLNSSEGSMSKS